MSAAYSTTTDFNVGASQALTVYDQDGVWLSRAAADPPPNLNIEGALGVVALQAYSGSELYGVRTFGDFTGAAFTLAAQSELRVIDDQVLVGDPTGPALYGIVSTASPSITVAGSVLVAASAQAVGVSASFAGPGGRVTNSGGVSAVSVNGAADAVRMESGGAFRNTVVIEAHGFTVARAVVINGHQGSFYNSGIITADSSDGSGHGYGVAVEWKSSLVPGGNGSFVNDGTLRGDFALVAKADGVNPAATQVFVNNGLLMGKVDLGEAPTQLINNRRIDGEVRFGSSNDLYDARGSTAVVVTTGTVFGGGGDDTMLGSAASDTLDGGEGANYLRGEDGDDLILGGSGYDNVNGNKGDDTIDGGSGGGDWLLGGQGDDIITARTGAGIINGNIGNDTIVGGSGSETLRGGQGDDSISAGEGNDWINGDRGDDVLRGGGGADLFNVSAGSGVDRVIDFNASEGDRIVVATGAPYTVSQSGSDTVVDLGGGDRLVLVGVSLSTSGNWIGT